MITITNTPVLSGIMDEATALWDKITGQQPPSSPPVQMTAVMRSTAPGSVAPPGSTQVMTSGGPSGGSMPTTFAPGQEPTFPPPWYKNYWILGAIGLGAVGVVGTTWALWPAKKSTPVSGHRRKRSY